MTIFWKGLEKEDRDRLHSFSMTPYLHGFCYPFAIALSRGLGWPMVGLIKNSTNACSSIWHAGVRAPDGMLWDARGSVKEEDFGKLYDLSPPYDIRPIEEKDLFAVMPMECMTGIALASKMAQSVWPELPWKPDTLKGRVTSFVEDLEKISRKHKIWIRACYPASPPVLSEGMDDEKGYQLEPTIDGLSYVINRVL